MVIQVLTDFQLEIIIIGEAISKIVIFDQICPIFWQFLVQIVSKISQFERISTFSDLRHGNKSSERVSTQNDHNWWSYCQNGNCAQNLAHILSKIAEFEWISEFPNIYHGNTHTDRVSSKNDHDWWRYFKKGNVATNFTNG